MVATTAIARAHGGSMIASKIELRIWCIFADRAEPIHDAPYQLTGGESANGLALPNSCRRYRSRRRGVPEIVMPLLGPRPGLPIFVMQRRRRAARVYKVERQRKAEPNPAIHRHGSRDRLAAHGRGAELKRRCAVVARHLQSR
jgi:hypothetical protein